MDKPSKIFVRYRALGFVTNHVPLTVRYINRRNENLVATAVGKSFHTYGCTKLNLLSVSGQHPEEISCLTSDEYHVYTACKNIIYAWRRGNECKHEYKGPDENVLFILPFGPHLLAVYEDNTLILWDIKAEEIELELPFTDISISSIMHPSGYLNKILIGSKEGCLQLWNIKDTKLIYTFNGWGSAVTMLEQAPAFDVVGIGLENGNMYIHNLRFDETLMKFSQDWGAVTGLSFRTDGPPLMASASTMGHVAIWDLKEKRLHSEIRDAHKGCVSGMRFLPNEPLLITSSSDNSIKIWIFDLPDEGGRLLKIRDGHSCPPLKIRFYGNDGKNIISAGMDSTVRSFSTEADNLNKSLGQASFNRKAAKRKGVAKDPKKMGPIVDFVSDATREKDWDNVAAIHRNSKIVTTWSYDRSCMGKHKLTHDRFKGLKNIEAVCLSISMCGNFVLIGYNSGHLDKYNIQSGVFRGAFGKDKAHNGSIRGLAIYNRLVVSGGSDSVLNFWELKDCTHVASVKMSFGIAKMNLHPESAMLAVALDNFSVIIVDMVTRKIVREFSGNEGSLSDMTFSPDSRWLITATMDTSIKTWDLPTGKLIDWFVVSPICVSIAISSTGEYLATAHAGSLGIYLWANATLYGNISLYPLPDSYNPQLCELPAITLDGQEGAEEEESALDEKVPEFKSPEQISRELITLSLLPQSHWLNLLDLDIIKRRNKPKEPVQIPKNAPFFLPVVSGLKPTFLIEQEKDWKKESENSKVLQVMQHGSEFFKLLKSSHESQNYEAVLNEIKGLSPSQIDIEIRCLSPENGGSIQCMKYFLNAMHEALKTNRNFELVHSYMALFLQIHYEAVASTDELKLILEDIYKLRPWDALQEKINFCLCLGNYARSAVI